MSCHALHPAPASFVLLLLSLQLLYNLAHAKIDRQPLLIGEVSQRDTDRPTYEVRFPPLGSTHPADLRQYQNPSPDVTIMRMVTARGQPMRCMLPPLPKPFSSPTVSEENRFDDIDDLLSSYKDKCFVKHDNWWTYEFCFGKYVVQRHLISEDHEPAPEEEDVSFVLGKFDKKLDLERRKNVSEVSTKDAPFTQLYVNGSQCDLTEKPRRVIIKYLCTDDAMHIKELSPHLKGSLTFLKAIREVESCVYEIEFMSSVICGHEAYMEKMEKTTKTIYCSMENEDAEFEGLMSTDYRKASLNL